MESLPHDLEAEMRLLGALLYDNKTFLHIPELSADSFYEPVHGRIYDAIAVRLSTGQMADGVTLRNIFAEDGALAEIGGAGYLATLMEHAAPLREAAIGYARHIRGLALRRQIVERAGAISYAAQSDFERGAEELLLLAQREMAALDVEGGSVDLWRPAGEVALHAVAKAAAGEAAGISTGIEELDDCTGGGRPGTLWVLGGATSMGKSVGGQQFAVNVARQGFGVAYVHLEMDVDEVGLRLASALAFEPKRIGWRDAEANPWYLSAARNKLHRDQWKRMGEAAGKAASTLNIYIDDRPGRTIAQIESATRTLFQKMRRDGVTPGLIVVDHEGLIAPSQKHPSELEAARARGNGLKDMAKRLGVWTIALSQITKDGSRAEGDDRLPSSLDLNYGSALSQAAHVVMLLHRKAYYAQRKPSSQKTLSDFDAMPTETTLIVDKARGGRRDKVEVFMDVASAVMISKGEAA